MKPEIIRTRSFVHDAVRYITDCASDAIDSHGFFRLSLSGGNTPKAVYQALSLVDCLWAKWIVTFGDERCVSPDDLQSNYRMAAESFLIVCTPGHVLRMKGELPPEEGANEYDMALKYLAERFRQTRLRHDLILLGLGDDGHTASLFPGTSALNETQRDVVCNFVSKLNAWRLTFTYPLINAAERVAFLVNDSKKEPIIDAVLRGGSQFPAEGVKPDSGELVWIIAR
jgi:6-phosphogluconolactonase